MTLITAGYSNDLNIVSVINVITQNLIGLLAERCSGHQSKQVRHAFKALIEFRWTPDISYPDIGMYEILFSVMFYLYDLCAEI